MNFGFIIDNRKCIGCHACTVACKAEHDVPLGVNRTWVKYIEKGEFPNTRRLFSVMRCNHCEDAPCVEICPVTALFRRPDGIVDFDNRRCIGCKGCMQACPYDALYIDPETHTAAKCNYCAHRVEIGLEPACVNVCPEHAIISGDLDNPVSEISHLLAREQVTARKVEKGTRPKLFYIKGDEASLKPAATATSSEYMWSSQTTGVGHFARYAEARMKRSGTEGEWVKEPESKGVNGEQIEVLLPKSGDVKTMRQKALAVITENARRVYDAPGKGVLWGWEVSAYVWTKAIATGVFLVLFIALAGGFTAVDDSTQWWSVATSLLFLFLTGLLLVKDLDQPKRFIYVLLRPQWRSWLVRGGYAITIYGGMLTLWSVSRWLEWQTLELFAFWGGAIFAVVTSVYTAFLFAQAKGRDFWQSPVLPIHMLVHSLMAGAAVLLAGATLMHPEVLNYLMNLLYISIIANLIVIGTELMTPHATDDAQATKHMIVSGPFAKSFWLGVLFAGNAMPLILIAFGGPALQMLASVLVLIGIYLTEHIWVRAPQMIALS